MKISKRPIWVCFMIAALLLFATPTVQACTNLLITCGASLSKSVMICYTCDAPFASKLFFLAGGKHKEGDIVSYPDMRAKGVTVKQVPHTYGVLLSNGIGHMNEHQLAIGETTFGGRRGLNDKDGLHYADLLTITLQRAKTAREAIKTIAELAAEYGYHQSGESISIGDTQEAWIMEIIGNGKGKKGIVYVAMRVPDGYISCHANQARIGEFPATIQIIVSTLRMLRKWPSKMDFTTLPLASHFILPTPTTPLPSGRKAVVRCAFGA